MNEKSSLNLTPRRRWSETGIARRRLIAVSIVMVLVVVTFWIVVASGGEDHAAHSAITGDTGAMAGMEGMPGMNMSGDGTVQVTADQLRQFGITFGTVDTRMLQSEVRTVGVVTFDETRIAQVAPKFGGFVERLHVDFTGQPVRRGQPLLEIYSPELVAAQEELLIAQQLARTMNESAVPGIPAGTTDLLAAARRRLRLWDIPDAQIEEILQSGQVRRALTLHAPGTGIVVEKNVVRGQSVQPGQMLYTIADLSEVWVEAELREADAGNVREGSGATLELAAYPGGLFKGWVEYVYPTLQEQSRTLRSRIAVANSDGRLKPGMYATVRITTPIRRALTVPASAVLRTGERSMVFVDMGGGSLMPHEVVTGNMGDEYVEVLSGVAPGQRVVTSAQFLLDSESNLADVMKAMMGQMGSGDMQGMDMPGMQRPESSATPRR